LDKVKPKGLNRLTGLERLTSRKSLRFCTGLIISCIEKPFKQSLAYGNKKAAVRTLNVLNLLNFLNVFKPLKRFIFAGHYVQNRQKYSISFSYGMGSLFFYELPENSVQCRLV
jgi:hypothetical protein